MDGIDVKPGKHMGRLISEILAVARLLSNRTATQRAMLAAVAAGALLQPKAGAQSYEGTGGLSYSWFGPTNAHKESSRFEFRVDDRRWWIRTVSTSNAVPDYREASFDGTTVYLLESLESIVQRNEAAGERINVATGFLQQGGEILHNVSLDEIPAIWLTFCSGSFFKRQTNAMVEPAITVGQVRDQYHRLPLKEKALWSLNMDFPLLPNEVRYIADGSIHLAGRDPTRRRAPFQDGFTNVVFRVDRFKTVDSLALPETATIETFRPGVRQDDSEKLTMTSRYELKLLSARRSNRSDETFAPRIPGPTHITDNRFYAKVGSLSYLITNWSEAKRR